MIRKILDVLAALSFLLSIGILGGSFVGYKYITSPQGQAKIKNAVMGDLKKAMPGQIKQQLPKTTGVGLPF